MSAQFNEDDKKYLYQIFDIKDHELREGAKTKDGTKMRWFVYLTWQAIQHHLEDRFFGEWSDEYHSARDLNGYSEVYCRLTIRGISRENNGSNSANSSQDENQGKGAATDAFKRTAAKWGIGLYLRDCPAIYTPYDYVTNGKTNWNLKNQREREAMQEFAKWLNTLGSPSKVVTTNFNKQQAPSEAPDNSSSSNGSGEKVTDEIVLLGVKKSGNNQYIVADGCTFFSRAVFRQLSYEDSVIETIGKIGVQTLPDPIRVVYVDDVKEDGTAYRKPLRVQRVSTGEVISMDELKQKVGA